MERTGQGAWSGRLPLLSTERPLFAFANVIYTVGQSESEPFAKPTGRCALSSLLHSVAPAAVSTAGARATDSADPLIDDFTHRWRDWYLLSADNPHHWEFST